MITSNRISLEAFSKMERDTSKTVNIQKMDKKQNVVAWENTCYITRQCFEKKINAE